MNMTAEEIESAYQKHAAALQEHWQAKEELLSARAKLANARAQKAGTGELDGKNETERDAKARALFPELFAAIEAAEALERRKDLEAELTRFGIYRVRTLLWLMSLRAGAATASVDDSLR